MTVVKMSCTLCGLSLTLTWLFSSVSHLASVLPTPPSPSHSFSILHLPSQPPPSRTMPTNHSSLFWPLLICHLFAFFCFNSCSFSPRASLLIYSFSSLLSLFSPFPLAPVLSLSHSALSPADRSEITFHRDHMTSSPIGSPPTPMSSHRLAPFPAKPRPARAALAALRRPARRTAHNAASLLLHPGLEHTDITLLPSQSPGNR